MEYKKTINKLTITMVVISTISFFLSSPISNGLCSDTDTSCGYLLSDTIGIPAFFFSLVILGLLCILRFMSESVFWSWSRFGALYIFITIILLSLFPVTSGSLIPLDKKFMSEFLAGLFLIISLILIAYKQFHRRAK